MLRSDCRQTIADFRKELGLIENGATRVAARFKGLVREAEASKVALLEMLLEEQIKSEARRKGMISVMKDKGQLRHGLLAAAGGLIVGGFITKDGLIALHAGLSGFDGALQRFGRAKWVVSLGKTIAVSSAEDGGSEGEWVPWEILKLAMGRLRNKALEGEALGSLDDVVSSLRRLAGLTPVTAWVRPGYRKKEP